MSSVFDFLRLVTKAYPGYALAAFMLVVLMYFAVMFIRIKKGKKPTYAAYLLFVWLPLLISSFGFCKMLHQIQQTNAINANAEYTKGLAIAVSYIGIRGAKTGSCVTYTYKVKNTVYTGYEQTIKIYYANDTLQVKYHAGKP